MTLKTKSKKIIAPPLNAVMFGENLALTFIHHVEQVLAEKDDEFANRAVLTAVGDIIGSVVYGALVNLQPTNTDQEAYDQAAESFATVKRNLEIVIAAGFSAAMGTFAGKDVDYFCQIKPIPTPVNKYSC